MHAQLSAPVAAKESVQGKGGKRRAKGAHAALIATFHALNKQLAAARARGDAAQATVLADRLEAMGGLERYQRASVKGEDLKSTNTSKWLLRKLGSLGKRPAAGEPRLTLLDVGALRVNYRRVGWIDADAIDLNSQEPGIIQADFFEYVPPRGRPRARAYDVVALSLVVNFVPEPRRRGEMLQKACGLLKPGGTLFLVLPRACVENSRYVTDALLRDIFSTLGLEVLLHHMSAKLAYYVLEIVDTGRHVSPDRSVFKRQVLRTGEGRNNFAIGLS